MKPTEEFEKAAIKRFHECGSIWKVKVEMGCHHRVIRKILVDNNIPIPIPAKDWYTHNKDFFKGNSEEVFYIAGFIAADGCLHQRHNRTLSLDLGRKDEEILVKILKCLDSTHPIHQRTDPADGIKRKNPSDKSEIHIHCKFLAEDLTNRFNITSAKSLTYQFPKWLINHPMAHHFIRGYFDGDGSWYINKGKATTQLGFEVLGTNQCISTINEILIKHAKIKRKDLRERTGCWALEFVGNIQGPKIGEYLYKDATIYLDRKYKKFHEHQEVIKNYRTNGTITRDGVWLPPRTAKQSAKSSAAAAIALEKSNPKAQRKLQQKR